MRTLLADAVRSLGRMFVDAARAFAAHWPQLITLFLLGWAGRLGVLWLVTEVSDWSPTVAVLLLPLAPLSTLLSLVLMLRALAPTLSSFSEMVQPVSARQRAKDDLTVAAQVLLPFLAVYASAGLLKQDVQTFLYDSATDESLNTNIQSIDWGRADYASGWLLIALIVGALLARKIITMRELAKKHLAWAAVGAYLEVLWMVTLAQAFSTQLKEVTDWVTSRQVIATIVGWWDAFIAWLRSWGGWMVATVESIGSFIGSLGSLVVVPVAWLAIGAAVYGHSLKAQELKVGTHEDFNARIKKVPQPVRRAVAHAVEPVTSPIKSALTAIGKIASAGIIPMALFCVVFALVAQVQALVTQGMRIVVGPGPSLRQYALEPYVNLVERGVYFLLAMVLLGAAVNVVVRSQQATQEEAPDTPAEASQSEPAPA